ncbi:MAG: endonuclease MutS2 [Anaerolineae bacterium]|nr:MAG: endonuclease MutS2 [Anaerolineae bacterium]
MPTIDEKTLRTLEYDRVLERLAAYCAFPPSVEAAHALRPAPDRIAAQQRLAETREARQLLAENPSFGIGGARDIRSALADAARGKMLEPAQLLDIKSTLVAARRLGRLLQRQEAEYPHLAELALGLPPSLGLIDAVNQAISERGEILDTASARLAAVRRDLKVERDRLLTQLERMVNNPQVAPYLQEALVTQRDGRFVLPVRADFKGKIKGIVHDQSASGATVFIEPLSVVERNNRLRELQLAEQEEERRVLVELTARVAENRHALESALEALAVVDLALARAKYAEALDAIEPQIIPLAADRRPQTTDGGLPSAVCRLFAARHPLLNPETVVPIDVVLPPGTRALVITGPNTGGKTVTLKTVGLLTLMAQSGLHIPAAAESEIAWFDAVYADIGDEQSIEQSLSTFSGHITNIRRILEQADERSLVLLDELGAGTDPQEGAALARALLNYLVARGITTLVTTHHPELKAYAHATPGVVNASVEFDLETLRPTYRLTIGLPGRSNALAIAERLGLPAEIIEEARREIHPDDLRADDLLDEIYRQRDAARQERAQAERARREADRLRNELAERLAAIEDERLQVLEDARRQAGQEIEALRDEIKTLREELRRARQPLEVVKAVEEKVEALEEKVAAPVRREEAPLQPVSGEVRLGSKVVVRTLGKEGVVRALDGERVEVQIGNLRVRARRGEVALRGVQQTDDDRPQAVVHQPSTAVRRPPSAAASPGIELDLRGHRADEALEALDRYLDKAYLARLPWVRIIHGKGTGRLRQAVRQALERHPHVASYEAGAPAEGGDGVTVVTLDL